MLKLLFVVYFTTLSACRHGMVFLSDLSSLKQDTIRSNFALAVVKSLYWTEFMLALPRRHKSLNISSELASLKRMDCIK